MSGPYRRVVYLTGVKVNEWEWDAGRQSTVYRIEYDEDVSKEVMAVVRAERVSSGQVEVPLVEPDQKDTGE